MKKLNILLMICMFVSLLLFLSTKSKGEKGIDFIWDPSFNAEYYRLFYGIESENYIYQTEKIYDKIFTVGNLEPDTIYYFAVKAYDSQDRASDFSNEVSATLDSCINPQPAPPTSGGGGTSASCFINTIFY